MFQITISENDRIYFTNLRGEQVVMGIPEEFEEAFRGLLAYCKTYKTPKDRAMEELLASAVDRVDSDVLMRLAPEFVEGEILAPNAVRVRDGEVIIADKKGRMPERPKEEPIIKAPPAQA